MGMAGLRDKYSRRVSADWIAHCAVEESRERLLHSKGLAISLAVLQEIAAGKDVELLLAVEEITLKQELLFYVNAPEEKNSVTTAIGQLHEALACLDIVKHAEHYRAATTTFPGKQKLNDLPLDGFREFIKSHTTRLTNRLAGQLSGPEKEILRQRKANLLVAKDVYVALQKKALELPPA